MPRLAEVLKVHPYFLSTQAAADFLGIAKKTLSNELSSGVFPVKPVYRNSKPLFPYSAIQEYARNLERGSNTPTKKRGRKRDSQSINEMNPKQRLG